MDQKLELLERVPLFAEVPGDVREQIGAVAMEVDVPADTALTHEGRHEGHFFIIVSGEVRVERGGDVVRNLGPGDFFGAIALLDGGPRTATATTATPCHLLKIAVEEFHELLESSTAIRTAILEAAANNLEAIDNEGST